MFKYHQQGFTLIEMLIAAALTIVVLVALISAFVSISRSLTVIQINRTLADNLTTSLEIFNRDLRLANDIAATGNSFDVHPGQLTIKTIDSAGVATTIKYSLTGNTLWRQVGSDAAVAITESNVKVNSLIFRQITTAVSKAVRVELVLSDIRSTKTFLINGYLTTGLRGGH